MGGGTLREKVLEFVWTNWFLYKIKRAGYLKKIINYIIYIKYMGGSGQVWRVCNFMTWTQPNLLSKKIFITQANPPSPKNQPNLASWVESS